MKTISLLCIAFALLVLPTSCVTKKKLREAEARKQKSIDSLQQRYTNIVRTRDSLDWLNHNLKLSLDSAKSDITAKNNRINTMNNDLNNIMSQCAANDARKTAQIDSLMGVMLSLSSDTTKLNASLRKAISGYRKQSDSLNVLRNDLNKKARRINDLENTISAKQQETDKLKQSIADALNAFTSDELKVTERDGKIFVSMEEELLFKLGSADVGAKGKDALKKLAAVLEQNKDMSILIEGHTDNEGSAGFNWDLSVKRATSVVKILQDNSTIDPARITAAGRGMYAPVAANDTDAGRAKNRRIEIIINPKLDQLYNLLKK